MQDARVSFCLKTLLAQCMQTCKQMPYTMPLLDDVLYLETAAQQKLHWLHGE